MKLLLKLFVVASLTLPYVGCSRTTDPNSRPIMTEAQHSHYHVHAVGATHEHSHSGKGTIGGHVHSHKHQE